MKHSGAPSCENCRKKSSATTCDRAVRRGNGDEDDDDVAIGSASFQTGDRHPSLARRLIAQLSPPSACYIIGPSHSRSPRLDRLSSVWYLPFRSASLISVLPYAAGKTSATKCCYRDVTDRLVSVSRYPRSPPDCSSYTSGRQSADRCIRVA